MFTTQSQTNLTLLMIAGAVFAAAGLWLLLKPKPTSGTAKIELFGLKFESSSAGVLVFLIGAAFLSIPLFAEVQKPPAQTAAATAQTGSSGKGATTSAMALPAGQMADPRPSSEALMLPPGPDAKESEPNDGLRQSNQIAIGSIVQGVAEANSVDWFVVPLPFDDHRKVELKIAILEGSSVTIEIYNGREEFITEISVYQGAKYHSLSVGSNDRLYVQVRGIPEPIYELSVHLLDES